MAMVLFQTWVREPDYEFVHTDGADEGWFLAEPGSHPDLAERFGIQRFIPEVVGTGVVHRVTSVAEASRPSIAKVYFVAAGPFFVDQS